MAKRKPRKNVDPEAVIELTNQMRTFGNELVPVEAVYHVKGLAPRTRGPWNKEAEKIAFRDSATGYSCIIRRSPQTGALEGFVAISPNHPLFNFSNGAVESVGITAYGGVNYARACEDGAPEWFSICHVVHHDTSTIAGGKSGDSGHPDPLWWIGFSCDQPGDILPNHPGTVAMSSSPLSLASPAHQPNQPTSKQDQRGKDGQRDGSDFQDREQDLDTVEAMLAASDRGHRQQPPQCGDRPN